jgi:hypothetical protein
LVVAAAVVVVELAVGGPLFTVVVRARLVAEVVVPQILAVAPVVLATLRDQV